LDVYHPLNFDEKAEVAAFEALGADVGVIVAYGLILPQVILDAPTKGCLNIHASLLPRWRGAAPIHRAIMAGDLVTGVCVMQMEAGLDTGPVLETVRTEILESDTTGVLHDRLSLIGRDAILGVLADGISAEAVEQKADEILYAPKIDKLEAEVDWARTAVEVDQHIRGLSPSPGAWTMVRGQRVKLLMSSVSEGTGDAGIALDETLRVACGSGAVNLVRLQRAGKEAMDWDTFLQGFTIVKGARLGRTRD
jgi:methionyl-tRNA formyltransferase